MAVSIQFKEGCGAPRVAHGVFRFRIAVHCTRIGHIEIARMRFTNEHRIVFGGFVQHAETPVGHIPNQRVPASY